MFERILAVQWKSVRHGLALLTVVAFGLPLMAVQNLGARPEDIDLAYGADVLFMSWQTWVPTFPILAGIIGAVIGMNAWNWDHKQGHTYALSLPISRGQYSLLKAAAGAVLLAIPVAAMGVGSMIASLTVNVPEGLNAYPLAFTLRFGLAALLVYSIFFALASSTIKTAVLVLGGFIALIVGGDIAAEFLRSTFVPDLLFRPSGLILEALGNWPGPFSVISGNWMLIDV